MRTINIEIKEVVNGWRIDFTDEESTLKRCSIPPEENTETYAQVMLILANWLEKEMRNHEKDICKDF